MNSAADSNEGACESKSTLRTAADAVDFDKLASCVQSKYICTSCTVSIVEAHNVKRLCTWQLHRQQADVISDWHKGSQL
jgi:ferredoxin